MSEEKNLEVMNDEELDEVAGGSSKSSEKAKKTNKACLKCQMAGKMNSPLYSYKKKLVCFETGHVYAGTKDCSSYIGIDEKFKKEARKSLS